MTWRHSGCLSAVPGVGAPQPLDLAPSEPRLSPPWVTRVCAAEPGLRGAQPSCWGPPPPPHPPRFALPHRGFRVLWLQSHTPSLCSCQLVTLRGVRVSLLRLKSGAYGTFFHPPPALLFRDLPTPRATGPLLLGAALRPALRPECGRPEGSPGAGTQALEGEAPLPPGPRPHKLLHPSGPRFPVQ